MRCILIILIFLLLASSFLPLLWISERGIEIDWVKFTEEYYKSWFSLVQLIIGFTFFTVLYNHLSETKKIRKLKKLKRVIEDFNTNFSSDYELTELKKSILIENVFISLYEQILPDDEELILNYSSIKEISKEKNVLLSSKDNPELAKQSISKIIAKIAECGTDANTRLGRS